MPGVNSTYNDLQQTKRLKFETPRPEKDWLESFRLKIEWLGKNRRNRLPSLRTPEFLVRASGEPLMTLRRFFFFFSWVFPGTVHAKSIQIL